MPLVPLVPLMLLLLLLLPGMGEDPLLGIGLSTLAGIVAGVVSAIGYLDSKYARKAEMREALRRVDSDITELKKIQTDFVRQMQDYREEDREIQSQVRESLARLEGAAGTQPPPSRNPLRKH